MSSGSEDVSSRPRTGGGLSARERVILSVLAELGGTAQLGDLAGTLLDRQYDSPPRRLPRAQIQRIYTELSTATIPQLERRGYLRYCRSEGVVTLTE